MSRVIGDYGDSSHGDFTGAAHVFGHDGGVWVLRAKLAASDSTGGQAFAVAVDVDGDDIAKGAPAGPGSGAVYMHSVAVADDALMVGGFAQEAAHVFRKGALNDPRSAVVLIRSTSMGRSLPAQRQPGCPSTSMRSLIASTTS